MSKGHASYNQFSLTVDIDQNSQKILDLFFKGALLAHDQSELDSLTQLCVGKTITEVQSLKRSQLHPTQKMIASLPYWLLQNALQDYLGTTSVVFEVSDQLCLCFGVTYRDLKKEILTRSDYELKDLIKETFATSACASCRPVIEATLIDLRSEFGLIKGLTHAQSRYDLEGRWVKIKGKYPSELLIELDDHLNFWLEREELRAQFKLEIKNIEGHHVWISIESLHEKKTDTERFNKILTAFGEYLKSKTGILFFLQLDLAL